MITRIFIKLIFRSLYLTQISKTIENKRISTELKKKNYCEIYEVLKDFDDVNAINSESEVI